MLRLITTMVSMKGAEVWADRRSGGPAVSAMTRPTANPPDRRTASLDRVNALVQGIGRVACRIVPLRKVHRRIYAARELPQTTGREPEAPSDRILPDRPAQAGDRRVRRNHRLSRANRVWYAGSEVADPPELEPHGKRVLVTHGVRRIELIAGEHHIAPRPRRRSTRVDPHADQRNPGIELDDEAAAPLPAAEGLDPGGVAGARDSVTRPQPERGEHGQRSSGVSRREPRRSATTRQPKTHRTVPGSPARWAPGRSTTSPDAGRHCRSARARGRRSAPRRAWSRRTRPTADRPASARPSAWRARDRERARSSDRTARRAAGATGDNSVEHQPIHYAPADNPAS